MAEPGAPPRAAAAPDRPEAAAEAAAVVAWLPPERPGGQGLDPAQEESGARALLALLGDPEVAAQVDLVATWRPEADAEGEGGAASPGAYEVWSARGLVRFRRGLTAEGRVVYPLLEVVGENPLARDDPHALRTLEEEAEAARATGGDAEDPARRFIGPAGQSYPFAYERVAQLFDSPNAPDLVVSPHDACFGTQPGNHGALHVRQSRAPLWLAGPGVRPGVFELAARAVDVAPTALAALGFPLVDGRDASGRSSSERGVPPDVRLARQDGRVLEEILDSEGRRPDFLYIFLLDGIHFTELEGRVAREPEALPGLRRLRERAAVLASGQIVNFPSITWPSHTTLGTGAWCGHHDVVNPSYYLRDKRESVSPQGQQVRTEGFVGPGVEGLFEAFRRARPEARTAAIHAPFGRGAHHAVLEGRNLGERARLKALTRELEAERDPRWATEGKEAVERESILDARGVAQVLDLYGREGEAPPELVYHELALTDGAGHDYGPHDPGLRAALEETDRRIARVLDALEARGVLERTLLVLTADHGMAPQDVALGANPARHVEAAGLEAVVHEPMIWLHDLRVAVERAADGRTARVLVRENDALPSGERPEVEGAEVRVELHAEGGERPRELVRGETGPGGVFGFATPSEVPSERIAVAVRRRGFNPRRLRLDGARLAPDPRAALFGR